MSGQDRIWAAGGHYWSSPTLKRGKTEYIRADLVAALVEALQETSAILQAAVVAGKVRGGDSYRIGGVYLQSVSDALDGADAALAAMKEGGQ